MQNNKKKSLYVKDYTNPYENVSESAVLLKQKIPHLYY